MQVFEFEAKTPEEAIDEACRELGLAREEMDIEIVEPGSAGIFGLVGGRKARIKVSVADREPPPEEAGAVEEEDLVQFAKETLETILALIPAEGVRVSAGTRDGAISLDIAGDASGLLIGRKGKTLDSLQYILSKIVNKRSRGRIQVIVDSENYRQRRFDSLVHMGLKMGDKAKRIGKPVSTNLLNAHDRRIIHMALKEDDEVDTKSRGEGMMKRVVIIPKK